MVNEHNGYLTVDQFQGTVEERYRSAIQYVRENQSFDVLFIVGPEHRIHYLHDLLKRDCISSGIPSQYLEKETLGKRAQGSVLHNIAVGTYAKAGGVPWRVKHPTISNSCILGLSFHVVGKKDVSQPHRTIVGVAEILDEFGRHLTMKVSQASVSQDVIRQFRREFRSLYVPHDLMETLVKEALSSTQWPDRTPPTRLVVHKTTAFHDEETTGLQSALEELEMNVEYALVHIREETVQRVYRESDKDTVRGMLLTFRDDVPEAVLWTVGKVPSRYRERGEYQYYEKSGSKIGTSDPVAVHLDPASQCSDFSVADAAKQVLALTKTRWNTVEMSIRLPTSIYLARRVGSFVAAALRHGADMTFLGRIDARHFW
jgi:argonaute-like protein implicated in RNA metabolism and viral defense